jgi:hypothetical protein
MPGPFYSRGDRRETDRPNLSPADCPRHIRGGSRQSESQARVAVPGPALRVLEERWDKDDLSAEEYQNYRLAIEMQTHIRMAERFKTRLVLAERERQTSDQTTLLTMRSVISGVFPPVRWPPVR